MMIKYSFKPIMPIRSGITISRARDPCSISGSNYIFLLKYTQQREMSNKKYSYCTWIHMFLQNLGVE